MLEKVHANHTFESVYNKESKVLILGSFPSVKSREIGFYYMYKYNRFWQVLSNIYDKDFIDNDIDHKKELLEKYHIALSDVIWECDIIGSSDNSIDNIKLTNIEEIINNSNIKYIYCNGKLAYNLFLKYFNKYQDLVHCLPSTSSSNAKWKLDDLINEWKVIKHE